MERKKRIRAKRFSPLFPNYRDDNGRIKSQISVSKSEIVDTVVSTSFRDKSAFTLEKQISVIRSDFASDRGFDA